jgi:hypothetical protein
MSINVRKSGRGRPRLDDAFAFYVLFEAARRRSNLSLYAFSRRPGAFLEADWTEDHFAEEPGSYRREGASRTSAALRRKWYRARAELELDGVSGDPLVDGARALTERAIADLMMA